VVLYDELSNRDLLQQAPLHAERIYVGKQQGKKTLEQEQICHLLVQHAQKGRTVVRLKGGDPFVFGRGGEEALAVTAAGIPCEIVPGISSAVAVPAYAGIPLTFRDWADGFEVLTGHQAPLASPKTCVMLMAMGRLAENVDELKAKGFSGEVPAAVIRCGTLSQQRTIVSTLDRIALEAAEVRPPAILVVGEVVRLRSALSWFEKKPLFGKRILVTRASHQNTEMGQLLQDQGAVAVNLPTIDIFPPPDLAPLRRALNQLSQYDFLLLTSANTVYQLAPLLAEQNQDARAFAGMVIAAVGPATAKALKETLGLRADWVASEHRAEGLLVRFEGQNLEGKRILLPQALKARELLAQALSARGAVVDQVSAYRTGLPEPEKTRIGLEQLEAEGVDALTFTSASSVENFVALAGAPRVPKLCQNKVIAAIGPLTRDACQQMGLKVDVMPDSSYTVPALIEALIHHYRGDHPHSSSRAPGAAVED
jgi:uroporphyrinogen III methyltransferase/synthase